MALLNIRPATVADAGLILHFIRELAIYEKAEHSVQTDEIGIAESLFGADATARALICEVDGEAIGYAVYFYNYSTWLGRKGIYLEDLYVSQEKRGVGAGKALLKYIARQAVAEGCGRFEWSFWTGTPRPSSSTPPLVPRRRTSGRCTGCRARHSRSMLPRNGSNCQSIVACSGTVRARSRTFLSFVRWIGKLVIIGLREIG